MESKTPALGITEQGEKGGVQLEGQREDTEHISQRLELHFREREPWARHLTPDKKVGRDH